MNVKIETTYAMSMLCNDDTELGREVLKIYHGYIKALDSVK